MMEQTGTATGSFFMGGCGCTFIFVIVTLTFVLITRNYIIVPVVWALVIFMIGGVGNLIHYDNKVKSPPQPIVTLEIQEFHCPHCLTLLDPHSVVDTTCPNCGMTLPTVSETNRATEALVQFYTGAYENLPRM